MAQLFVSHSSTDNALAVRVREALAALGYESVFLDVDANDGLAPGRAWRDQLFDHLASSDAVVFVGTPAANLSQWCHSELALARWLRKPVLSLLIDASKPHDLAGDEQGVAIASNSPIAEQIGAAVDKLGLDPASRWEATRSPFPGLRAFDESLAPVFFGREEQVAKLRALLDSGGHSRSGTIVPVLGPSGSGKSSLVRAGLIASLRPAPGWVVSEPWTPSDVPIAEMALSLAHAAKRIDPDLDAVLDAGECATLLRKRGGMAEYLRRIRGVAAHVPADARVLIVIDQAEELLTLTSDDECNRFFDAVTTSCEPPSPLRVVMTARTDLWDRLAARLALVSSSHTSPALTLSPLARPDLVRVVTEPARRSHIEIEPGLLERLVDDTGSGDALPLLAFTLARMTSGGTRRLTLAGYDAIGGVQGAIATRASEVAGAGRSESDVAAAVLQLVAFVDGRPTTRLAPVAEVPLDQRQILDDLVEARLVVVRDGGARPVYAPAHEALFSAWRPLDDLIKGRREDLVVRARLERRAADWREAGAGSSGLLSGIELDQARDWLSRNPDLGTPDTVAYVRTSRRRARLGQLTRLAVGVVVLGLLTTLVVVLLRNAREDQRQARQAQIGELRAIAERELTRDPAAAAIALLEARRIDADDPATNDLIDQLLSSPARDLLDAGTGSTIVHATAGTRLVVATAPDATIAWDTTTGSRWADLPFSSNAAIRPDDRVVALATDKQGVEIYDLEQRRPTRLSGLGVEAALLDFSPDGSLLATADKTVIDIWDVSDPRKPISLATWRTPGSDLSAIDVSDDGRVLASGDGGVLMTWEAIDGGERTYVLGPPTTGAPAADAIFVDEQGSRVLLTGWVSGYPLFDLASQQQVATYPETGATSTGPNEFIWSGAMNRAGSVVAVFTFGGRGFAFATDSGEEIAAMSGGHTGVASTVSFLSSGLLVTSSYDGTLRVWDPSAPDRGSGASTPERALCDVFGPRMEFASWQLAMGDTRFDTPCPPPPATAIDGPLSASPSRPDRQVSPPALTIPEPVVLDETFDAGTTLFATGDTPAGAGTFSSSVVDGQYRLSLADVGEGALWFQGLPYPNPFGAIAFSASVAAADAQSACGVVFGDEGSVLAVTVDPAKGQATLTWMTDGTFTASRQWPVEVSTRTDVTVMRDGGAVEILLDGTAVIRLWNNAFESVTMVGLVVAGDTATCDFDDVTLRADG